WRFGLCLYVRNISMRSHLNILACIDCPCLQQRFHLGFRLPQFVQYLECVLPEQWCPLPYFARRGRKLHGYAWNGRWLSTSGMLDPRQHITTRKMGFVKDFGSIVDRTARNPPAE